MLAELSKIRAGYPMGWRKYARGTQGNRMPPFVQPTDPDDRRSQIPALGLREYWYPALPAKDVGWKKPEVLRICGEDLVFFRDKQGEVQALWDYCPHRGAYLSSGDCFWKGPIAALPEAGCVARSKCPIGYSASTTRSRRSRGCRHCRHARRGRLAI